MRKEFLYSTGDEEIEGYEKVPVRDYTLYYDPARASIDDVIDLVDDFDSDDFDRTEKFWDSVDEV
jgi:hypothetical protein